MGGLVAALVATYTLTWFLLAMGFAFELPVSAPRRTKAQMAAPLAGGAAICPYFWRTCRSIVRFYFYDQGGLGHGISS